MEITAYLDCLVPSITFFAAVLGPGQQASISDGEAPSFVAYNSEFSAKSVVK